MRLLKKNLTWGCSSCKDSLAAFATHAGNEQVEMRGWQSKSWLLNEALRMASSLGFNVDPVHSFTLLERIEQNHDCKDFRALIQA